MEFFGKFIEYHKGNIPLILSISHGGKIKIEEIPTRTEGIIGADKKTISMAFELIKSIEDIYQSKGSAKKGPSYILSKIHRSKIDLNRIESEAYDVTSILAGQIYQNYHNKIEELIHYNLKRFNRSIMIDIHGFEKKDIPLGYRDVDIILGTNNLETLFSAPIPKRLWGHNIRGKIIKTFINVGISIAPGHQRRKEYALKGGYITQKYGANNIENSQTMQIEFSDKVRIYNEHLRKKVISTLAALFFDEFA
ncbi:MAG: N-formylglutamate amidohydrolase [Candidatus Hodarchaeota archaeon]